MAKADKERASTILQTAQAILQQEYLYLEELLIDIQLRQSRRTGIIMYQNIHAQHTDRT